MTIEQKTIELFIVNKELTVKELTFKLQASKQMVHLVLKKLVSNNTLEKLGRTPKTVYRLVEGKNVVVAQNLPIVSNSTKELLDQNVVLITETGNLIQGLEAFGQWCTKRNQPVEKTLNEFIKTKEKYAGYYDKNGIISGTAKLIKTYQEKTFLNEVYYLDFYAIERFGKTRLGMLLHYAKQGQNLFLMNLMMNEIHDRIITFIASNKIEAVGFVPPTIRREVQIMKFIQENLRIALPVLDIKKISGIIPVPQKSLSKLDERIRNAENTFAVTDQRKFNKVLLIDDAVGSGSTLNEIAGKIKTKKIAKEVIGLAVVGSFKRFDVITDI
jgi:hypothetical protein